MSEEFQNEERELATEILAAFDGVTREGGVSWRETNVLDEYGSMEDRLEARRQDTDRSWHEVAEDPPWLKTWGSFSFFDAIGFRYYLAAAMLQGVRIAADVGELSLGFHLTLGTPGLHEHVLGQWSLLDERQRRCVAWFLDFMDRREHALAEVGSLWEKFLERHGSEWRTAYDSYWHQFYPI